MSGFIHDQATLERIQRELPDLHSLQRTVLRLVPDMISMNFDPLSYVPVAAVCLNDATDALSDARHALHEGLANKIWYQEKRNPPDEFAAVFTTRFYFDDVAIRLYSAGEHLANAIIFMKGIPEDELKAYRGGKISQQAIVGCFLAERDPHDTITKEILRLPNSEEWRKTIDYRNRWVHEQPPTVSGLGILYKRHRRWRPSADGKSYRLGVGGGDQPEYSIDELQRLIQPALFLFTEVLNVVVEVYTGLLKNCGITITSTGLQNQWGFRESKQPNRAPAARASDTHERHG